MKNQKCLSLNWLHSSVPSTIFVRCSVSQCVLLIVVSCSLLHVRLLMILLLLFNDTMFCLFSFYSLFLCFKFAVHICHVFQFFSNSHVLLLQVLSELPWFTRICFLLFSLLPAHTIWSIEMMIYLICHHPSWLVAHFLVRSFFLYNCNSLLDNIKFA